MHYKIRRKNRKKSVQIGQLELMKMVDELTLKWRRNKRKEWRNMKDLWM